MMQTLLNFGPKWDKKKTYRGSVLLQQRNYSMVKQKNQFREKKSYWDIASLCLTRIPFSSSICNNVGFAMKISFGKIPNY